MTDLRLHVVPLANQELDGNGLAIHSAQVTPLEFAALIDRVNPFFAPAGIRFMVDPEVDWRPLADTELNSDGANMRPRGNQLAAGIPVRCCACFAGGRIHFRRRATVTHTRRREP